MPKLRTLWLRGLHHLRTIDNAIIRPSRIKFGPSLSTLVLQNPCFFPGEIFEFWKLCSPWLKDIRLVPPTSDQDLAFFGVNNFCAAELFPVEAGVPQLSLLTEPVGGTRILKLSGLEEHESDVVLFSSTNLPESRGTYL